MIDVDFIEIGTSDFDTYVENANDNEIGFCIEPIKDYLDKLPNKPNVKKINCAISFDGTDGEIKIFYIPETVLKENDLPWELKGCNSIGNYHYQHTKRKLEHLVKVDIVKQISISKFLKENQIRKIKYLKTDTEGGDCYILNQLLEYLKDKSIDYYPDKIKFETNKLTAENIILETISNFIKLGYESSSTGSFYKDGDTTLILKK